MKKKIIVIIMIIFITGCTTYNITLDSLQSQINNKSHINCIDKNGNEHTLTPSIHTGIRITKKDDTKQTFYFVTIHIQDSLITGSKSAIFNIPIKPIKLSEIKKIEIDGR